MPSFQKYLEEDDSCYFINMFGIPRYLFLSLSALAILGGKAYSEEDTCRGQFDVYFVIDKSSSLLKVNVNHFKEETVSFVTELSRKFVNPLLRMSYITFSTTAEVIMPLTSDRSIVEGKLLELKTIIPDGPTLMHLGIEKANKQIYKLQDKRASIIIVLTDGKLEPSTKTSAVIQANQARALGSTLFVVGVSNYDENQLLDIAGGSQRFVFHAEEFSDLDRVANEILISSCVEVLSSEPDSVCSNETFSLTVRGKGFNNTGITSLIKCNFWTEEFTDVLVTPDEIRDDYLKCSSPTGFTLKNEEKITVQVSLNGGVSFVSSNVTVTAYVCMTSSATVWLILFLLLVLALVSLWWLSNFICCVSSAPKEKRSATTLPLPPPPPPALPSVPPSNKTHWPAVDASKYGGAGVGGIKPVPVRWGDKGCTEAAMHLEKTRDAREVGYVKKKPDELIEVSQEEHENKPKGCLGNSMKLLKTIFWPLIKIYTLLAVMKPTREEVGKCILLRRESSPRNESMKRGSYLDTAT